jgi:hypothetical protein
MQRFWGGETGRNKDRAIGQERQADKRTEPLKRRDSRQKDIVPGQKNR